MLDLAVDRILQSLAQHVVLSFRLAESWPGGFRFTGREYRSPAGALALRRLLGERLDRGGDFATETRERSAHG
jgi:hypothetical protein